MNKKRIIISIAIKLAAIIVVVIGVILNIFSDGEFMAGSKSLLYFTIQSNILAAIVCLFGLVFDFKRLKKNREFDNKFFNHLKLVTTTGVILTLIVFWTMLMQMVPTSYLASVSNLTLHTFGPLLVLLDYIFFTNDFKPSKKAILYVCILPLAYFAFAMILSTTNVRFGEGNKVPYFFLDYEKYGWFKITGGKIGVFYWVIIVLIIVYLIGLGINFLHQLSQKKRNLN